MTLLRIAAIVTVIAWSHLFVLSAPDARFYGHDPMSALVNISVAVLSLGVIAASVYAALRPSRGFALVALIASLLPAFLIARGLWLHVRSYHWLHSTTEAAAALATRTGLAWIYGVIWFVPLPFLWATNYLQLGRVNKT